MRIAHASIDENKNTKGGQAGNQSGKEVCIREWYNKPWTVLLRHPDRQTREHIATIAETLSSPPYNSLIGYDQNERNSFHRVAQTVGYDLLDFINRHETCETDCSAFVTCVCLFAGMKKLEYTGNAPTTSTMKSVFKQAGFNVLTDRKYVGGTDYLSKGDILLKPGSHVVIVLDDGKLYNNQSGIQYFPRYTGNSYSLSDALKEMGIDNSRKYRAKIYAANFPDKYTFSGAQNTSVLILFKEGRLKRP